VTDSYRRAAGRGKRKHEEEDKMNLPKLLLFLNQLEKLKCITRHSWISNGRQESVAEHSWRLAVLVLVLKDNLKDYDIDKLVKMALFHDLGEVKFGDVPGFLKTQKDIENEAQALDELEDIFKELDISEFVDAAREFDKKETNEAKLLNALDKIEGLIQHNEADLSTWIEREYELNLTYGVEESEIDPLLKDLRNQVKEVAQRKMKEKEPRSVE